MINQGRYTSEKKDVVVFLIGMRINQPLAVNKWLPVAMAMPPMIKELMADKELGCLSVEQFFSGRTVMIVQYWESTDKLLTYARAPKHLKAWKKFIKRTKDNDAVGFYHETYDMTRGEFENIYVNMPDFGLGKAIGNKKVDIKTEKASERLKQ